MESSMMLILFLVLVAVAIAVYLMNGKVTQKQVLLDCDALKDKIDMLEGNCKLLAEGTEPIRLAECQKNLQDARASVSSCKNKVMELPQLNQNVNPNA